MLSDIDTLKADPNAPKVSVTGSVRRILKPTPPFTSVRRVLEPPPPFTLDSSPRPERLDPDKLQSTFQTKLDDYNEAFKNLASDGPSVVNDCENNLREIIDKFTTCIIVRSRFYPQIVKLKAIQSMIELLKDNNNKCGIRLATSILSVFKELTRVNIAVKDHEKQATAFVESLLVSSLDVFVSVLGKFSEDEEDVVFLAVQNIAQMIFLVPSLAETVANTDLISWVSKTLGGPRWNSPKQHAVGLLETLLVSSMANRHQFGTMGFVGVVVNALSSLLRPYEYIEREDGEEDQDQLREDEEDHLLGTLFRSNLLLLLEVSENKEKFANAGGVELMIRFIQNRDLSYGYSGTAIEALDIAVKGCQSACEKFVSDAWGLDIAFCGSVDKTPLSFTHEKEEIREHLISLIASLTSGITKTENNILLKKFEENDCEKIKWLMKLLLRYSEQVEKLRHGLSTLRSIAVILGYLWSFMNHTIIAARMSHYKSEKKLVHDVLSAYRDHTGNEGESSAAKTVIVECIDSLEEN